jgi:hypothetical protein
MTRRIRLLLGVAVVTLAAPAGAQHDSLIGTWVLNVGKSTYSPGPAPKSQTTIIEAAGRGYKITVKSEPAVGSPLSWSYTTALDGRDAPITGANPNADTALMKRVSATTTETVFKKGGRVTTMNSAIVSADGKTRTVTTTGSDGAGGKVKNVAVYEKR